LSLQLFGTETLPISILSPCFSYSGGFFRSFGLIILGGILQRIKRPLRRLLQHLQQTLGAIDLGLGKVIDEAVKAVS
jgi:hypothetical protein